jgi:hypothetical protein
MGNAPTLRKVPWTCKWGQFGGPVSQPEAAIPGFVFWMCAHPSVTAATRGPLTRGSCEQCPDWEPTGDEADG